MQYRKVQEVKKGTELLQFAIPDIRIAIVLYVILWQSGDGPDLHKQYEVMCVVARKTERKEKTICYNIHDAIAWQFIYG